MRKTMIYNKLGKWGVSIPASPPYTFHNSLFSLQLCVTAVESSH